MVGAAVDPNLFSLRAAGHRPPLFLVAAPGVNALGYTAVARLLPSDQPVYVVQPRRRGSTFPSEGIGPGGRDEYPIVAARYLRAVRAVQPRGPYTLVGMCDGAHLAFHMTRLLEEEGERVARLVVLDTWPLENTTIYPLVMLNIGWRGLHSKSPKERWALLGRMLSGAIGRGRTLLGIRAQPKESAPAEAIRRALWRARLWPGPGFRPPVIEAPIAVFRVQEQPYWRIRDEALGWRGRTRGEVTVHVVPGDHVSFIRAPHVQVFTRALGAYLSQSTAR